MTYAERFASILEPEIEDPEEETFLLYSQPIPSSNLGFVDPRASTVEARVGGADYTIHQSPGVLSSNRAGGTTGAGTTARPPSSISPKKRANTKETCAPPPPGQLSLPRLAAVSRRHLGRAGARVRHLAAQRLCARAARRLAHADGPGVRAAVRAAQPRRKHRPVSDRRARRTQIQTRQAAPLRPASNIAFATLDWETDSLPARRSYDAVLAVDCVYNYALIPPLVQTCAEACRRRAQQQQEEEAGGDGGSGPRPSLCIVAQQLRNDDVFRTWLAAFVDAFYVWRVPDDKLPEALRPSAGFVVHIGILRD
ncbi:Cytosine deaminase FCY1 [Cordyceps militaris]|uniref:Cytosine deaminase FCY1 n=1 Tax=Cordyceps militaris TaxID=73501 RepID=A0A2H4SNE4_CORMI|nr:Cytosine deaminase FCY1 [Cordyceps militaris]